MPLKRKTFFLSEENIETLQEYARCMRLSESGALRLLLHGKRIEGQPNGIAQYPRGRPKKAPPQTEKCMPNFSKALSGVQK